MGDSLISFKVPELTLTIGGLKVSLIDKSVSRISNRPSSYYFYYESDGFG